MVTLLAVLGTTGVLIGSGDLGPTAPGACRLLLVLLAPAAIVLGSSARRGATQAITVRTMFGVLCVYLLLGIGLRVRLSG